MVKKEQGRGQLIGRKHLQVQWEAYTIWKRRDHLGKKVNSELDKGSQRRQ